MDLEGIEDSRIFIASTIIGESSHGNTNNLVVNYRSRFLFFQNSKTEIQITALFFWIWGGEEAKQFSTKRTFLKTTTKITFKSLFNVHFMLNVLFIHHTAL